MEINKLISTIIIFVIILILIFLFVMPKYQEAGDLQNILAQKQAEYDGKSAYYTKVSKTIKDMEGRKDVSETISSALPPYFSLAPLVYFFHKKGTEAGLTITSIVFSETPPLSADKKIKNIIFKVGTSGSYQGLKNFLFSLDASARLFEVSSISFASQEALEDLKQPKDQQHIYDFQLEVKTNSY